jgi:hypothetical protein
METKKCCSKCNVDKSLGDFYLRCNKQINQCKDCVKAASKDAYEKYKQAHNGKSRNTVFYQPKFQQHEVGCVSCGGLFKKIQPGHLYCSKKCKQKAKAAINTTERQYALLSNNLGRYLTALISRKDRKKGGLTKDYLIDLYKRQNGLCALSGVPMTFKREKGTILNTNISIDRIIAGGPYNPENTQLVCVALNKFRINTTVEEYINWCRKVTEYNDKETKTLQ